MLAPKVLSPEYASWNTQWGAPHGRPGYQYWPLHGTRFDFRRRGPFAWQANNSTREFEYPWVFEQVTRRGPKLSVVDIGGSLSGLQYVLAKSGYDVTNVDPGVAAGGRGWVVSSEFHQFLGRQLSAEVRLISESIQNANLPDESVDVVVSVSAVEHFSSDDLAQTAKHVSRILKRGGVFVLTVDLFLDLFPFCPATANEWGTNISVKDFIAQCGLELVEGKRSELYGYDEFHAPDVLKNLSKYHIGRGYPSMAQCLVAKKS